MYTELVIFDSSFDHAVFADRLGIKKHEIMTASLIAMAGLSLSISMAIARLIRKFLNVCCAGVDMSRDIRILCIRTKNHQFAPLAWTDREISNKKLRRLVKRFRTDADFLDGIVVSWYRLYDSLAEAKETLPKI